MCRCDPLSCLKLVEGIAAFWFSELDDEWNAFEAATQAYLEGGAEGPPPQPAPPRERTRSPEPGKASLNFSDSHGPLSVLGRMGLTIAASIKVRRLSKGEGDAMICYGFTLKGWYRDRWHGELPGGVSGFAEYDDGHPFPTEAIWCAMEVTPTGSVPWRWLWFPQWTAFARRLP
jgi:hypothetical protein